MKKEEFIKLWERGAAVGSSWNVPYPDSFGDFPEQVTDEIHKGAPIYGVHIAHEDIQEFRIDKELCCFGLEAFSEVSLNRRKDSHGQNVYLVMLLPDEMYPVQEVEYGREYRQIAGLCRIKKVNL